MPQTTWYEATRATISETCWSEAERLYSFLNSNPGLHAMNLLAATGRRIVIVGQTHNSRGNYFALDGNGLFQMMDGGKIVTPCSPLFMFSALEYRPNDFEYLGKNDIIAWLTGELDKIAEERLADGMGG